MKGEVGMRWSSGIRGGFRGGRELVERQQEGCGVSRKKRGNGRHKWSLADRH